MKTPSIKQLRHKSATKTGIYPGHLVWNLQKNKNEFIGNEKMSKLRSRIEGHICQGGKYPGTIRKYPFILCSLCLKDAVEVIMSEKEIDDHNKELWKCSKDSENTV